MTGTDVKPAIPSDLAFILALVLCFAAHTVAQVKPDVSSTTALPVARRVDFVRSFFSEQEVNPRRSLLGRMVDLVAGQRRFHNMVRPYGITTDSRGRILVSDPGALAVHIFDFKNRRYSRIEGSPREKFKSPIGIAVDLEDNIYVTDSELGKIFQFRPNGKFSGFLREKSGEGLFKRPTGIAIDAKNKVMYVTDTLAHKVFKLDLKGAVIKSFGQRGTGPGEFNFPAGIRLFGETLIVVDAMNFRVQIFGLEGAPRGAFGRLGDQTGTMNRPKGIATDSEGNIYLADALFETVQVFDRDGRLLYYFGGTGSKPGEFQLPGGVWIDSEDKIYVADSYNSRVQIFQLVRATRTAPGQGN